jgi:phosphonate transport system substrate-binding protein
MLEGPLSDRTGLAVEVKVSTHYSDALQALCDGTAVAVSLDAFAYLAAAGQGCAEPLFQVERSGTPARSKLVAAADRIFSIENFRDRTFCRAGADSLAGWIEPALALRAAGIDPFADLREVVDAGSDEDVLALIAAGRCEVGALAYEAALPEGVEVIAELPPVPGDTIALSARLDGDTRALLIDVLRQAQDDLAVALGADELRPADDTEFDRLRELLAGAGVDVLALAQ